MSSYENVIRAPLKLKGGLPDGAVKKKKKKSSQVAEKEKEKVPVVQPVNPDYKTEYEKKVEEKMFERASKTVTSSAHQTHKQRMENMNRQLANLTEHFDLPKIGPG